MKWVLFAIILVLVLVLAGWISFAKSQDKATITIETKDIKQDTRKAVRKGKEFIQKTKDELKARKRSSDSNEKADGAESTKRDVDGARGQDTDGKRSRTEEPQEQEEERPVAP